MALAVAWADWVMSCCGVGSEAMSQLVRSEKQGGGHKNINILEAISWIGLKFAQHFSGSVC